MHKCYLSFHLELGLLSFITTEQIKFFFYIFSSVLEQLIKSNVISFSSDTDISTHTYNQSFIYLWISTLIPSAPSSPFPMLFLLLSSSCSSCPCCFCPLAPSSISSIYNGASRGGKEPTSTRPSRFSPQSPIFILKSSIHL